MSLQKGRGLFCKIFLKALVMLRLKVLPEHISELRRIRRLPFTFTGLSKNIYGNITEREVLQMEKEHSARLGYMERRVATLSV